MLAPFALCSIVLAQVTYESGCGQRLCHQAKSLSTVFTTRENPGNFSVLGGHREGKANEGFLSGTAHGLVGLSRPIKNNLKKHFYGATIRHFSTAPLVGQPLHPIAMPLSYSSYPLLPHLVSLFSQSRFPFPHPHHNIITPTKDHCRTLLRHSATSICRTRPSKDTAWMHTVLYDILVQKRLPCTVLYSP